jgi:UDP-N-acetylmuramyl tripeptide synthase
LSKTLSQILNRPCEVDPVITGVTADSRKVREGFLFAALPGSKATAASFIPGAIASGAAAVLAPDDVEDLGSRWSTPATCAAPTPWPPPSSGASSRRPASR